MNIDQEIDNRIADKIYGLSLSTEWVGEQPNLWGIRIDLNLNGCPISSAYLNLFDEKIQ